MVFWREHDELFNRFPEEFKNSKYSHPVPFIFVSYCLMGKDKTRIRMRNGAD